jgi:predicted dehydrogenase
MRIITQACRKLRKLLACHQRNNCIVALGYHLRWHPGLRLLAEKVNSTEFGKINHISIHWAHTFIQEASWRKSQELSRWWSISALTTHCLDIIRWMMVGKCGEVKNIKTLTTNKVFSSNDESTIISLEFESGATATIYTSILFDSPFQIDVYGDKNNASGSNVTSSKEKGEVTLNKVSLEYPHPNNLYACELKNFSNAIKGIDDVEVSLSEGISNVELLLSS